MADADTPLGRVITRTDSVKSSEDLGRVVKRAAEAIALAVALAGGTEAPAASATSDPVDAGLTGKPTSFEVLLTRFSALGSDPPPGDARTLIPIALILKSAKKHVHG